MPGYVIHIVIANEYIRKHQGEIKDKKTFIKGTIAPDLSNDKYKSHYGNYAEKHIGLSNFMKQTEIDINSDYGKGYFLHLIADELFYHTTFKNEALYVKKKHLKTFHHDYDCLNKELFRNYKINELPYEVKKYAKEINEKPELLDFERTKEFIDNLSEISIQEQIDTINNKKNPII